MIDRMSLGMAPEVPRNPNYDNAVKSEAPAPGALDFEKLISESNASDKIEQEKAKLENGGKELKFGETKSDVEFKEKLEKITGKKQDKLKNKLEKEDYLNLMVTQMRYQDPTKPMENQEMATQMAQFNSVEQLMGINKLLTQLNDSQTSARGDKLTQYLGNNVELQGDTMQLGSAGLTHDAFMDLPDNAGTVVVSVKDANGSVVKGLKIGSQDAGKHKIDWDGTNDKGAKLSPGKYTFVIEAATVEGRPITARSSIAVKVDGITSLAEGGKLDTAAGVLDPKNILSIRAPSIAVAQNIIPAQNVANAQNTSQVAPVATQQSEQKIMAKAEKNEDKKDNMNNDIKEKFSKVKHNKEERTKLKESKEHSAA